MAIKQAHLNLLYNEILPITGTILPVLKGEADVVDAVDGGEVHHAVPAFKGKLCRCIRHLFKGIQEGSHVGAGRLLFLNLGGDFSSRVFARSKRCTKLS